jgi:hypothetical protein
MSDDSEGRALVQAILDRKQRSAARIGHCQRPDRAWEVWNSNYERDGSHHRRSKLQRPWTIWHPEIESVTDEFETHAEAIAYISAGNWAA